MVNFYSYSIGLAMLLSVFVSCSKDDEVAPEAMETEANASLQIKQFIWSGLNRFYFYKSTANRLENNAFSSSTALDNYLNGFDTPEALFNASLSSADRFSFLTNDYLKLEDVLSGRGKSNGMSYSIIFTSPGVSNAAVGFVRYVLPGSDAEQKGIRRGTIFSSVNNIPVSDQRAFNTLENNDTYTLQLATFPGGALFGTPTGEEVTLVKSNITDLKPVFINKTIVHEGRTVGYLMYNNFVQKADEELNAAFGQFKADGVSDLIIDLRYNPGGSLRSAVDLAAMITGQFPNEIFAERTWNQDQQAIIQDRDPEELIDRFRDTLRTGTPINSLLLNKVYFLTSSRTASASELLINGLKPYIEVIQLGETTVGKFEASNIFYDSPDFTRTGVNEGHRYAMLPLIFGLKNKNGVNTRNGLLPDVVFTEPISRTGPLGDPEEPFLALALEQIANGGTTITKNAATPPYQIIGESSMYLPTYQKTIVAP